jgi:hypothetical protein
MQNECTLEFKTRVDPCKGSARSIGTFKGFSSGECPSCPEIDAGAGGGTDGSMGASVGIEPPRGGKRGWGKGSKGGRFGGGGGGGDREC